MKIHENFVELISQKRRLFLILFLIFNILSVIGIFKIRIDTDLALFMPENSSAMTEYEKMGEYFSNVDQLIFVIKSSQRNETGVLQEFLEIQKGIENIDGVQFVSGPLPPMIPSGLSVKKIEQVDEDNSNLIMNYIDRMGSLKSLYIEEDGYYGFFTINPDPMIATVTAGEILEYVKSTGLDYYNSGDVYLQSSLFEYILQIIFFIPPFAIFFLLLIFRWKLGNLKSTILSILPAGIGALWTMGLLGWTSLELSAITVLSPVFTIVMGSADGLHFMSHIQDEIEKGSSLKKALKETLMRVGWPMILTTLTTIAGFMSLFVVQSAPMRQLAMTASIGIALAGFATWFFLPVICIGLKTIGKSSKKTNERFDPVTPILKKSMGKKSIILTILICTLFLPGIFLIQTDLNMINIYKERTEIRKSMDKISEISGGAIPMFVEIETETDPLLPENAEQVILLERELAERGISQKAVSIYNIFATLNSLFFGADEDTYPKNMIQVNLMYNLLTSNQPQMVETSILRDQNISRIVIFPKNLSNEILTELTQIAEDYSTEKIKFHAIGIPFMMKEMNDRIMPDQVGSIFLAVMLVFALMIVTLRSIKMAFIAIVPLAATLISLFGFMGYASIDLSIITSTIASITIGVGIDYSIHLTSLFKQFLKEKTSKEAARLAFEYVEKPVIANALGLALGLSALLFSPLQFHTYMSMLMWVTMLVSSFVSLTFLPTLLERFFRGKK